MSNGELGAGPCLATWLAISTSVQGGLLVGGCREGIGSLFVVTSLVTLCWPGGTSPGGVLELDRGRLLLVMVSSVRCTCCEGISCTRRLFIMCWPSWTGPCGSLLLNFRLLCWLLIQGLSGRSKSCTVVAERATTFEERRGKFLSLWCSERIISSERIVSREGSQNCLTWRVEETQR